MKTGEKRKYTMHTEQATAGERTAATGLVASDFYIFLWLSDLGHLTHPQSILRYVLVVMDRSPGRESLEEKTFKHMAACGHKPGLKTIFSSLPWDSTVTTFH